MTGPASIPVLTAVRFDDSYVPTCLSNGVVGITPGANPLLQGKVLVSGFVHSHLRYRFEAIAPSPYPFGLDLRLDGQGMRQEPASVGVHSQALDMGTGELATRMTWRPAAGVAIDLEIVQFVSRTVPSLACQEVRIRSARECKIEASTSIDTDGIAASLFTGDTDAFTRGWYREDLVDRCMGFSTDRSRLGIATIVTKRPEIERRAPGRYTVRTPPGSPAPVRIIAALVPECSSPDPHLEAVRLARWGEMLGFETLRADNRAAWSELWKSRILIQGNPDDQRGIDAAFYYYQSSMHPCARNGIPPFGLAQHDYYYGHVFWDMDLWMLIPAILTAPASARAILAFRARGLEPARRRAALFGCRGAQYPWESSRDGWEATPSCCPTGWAEQHVTPAVAIGAWECQRALGDEDTMCGVTWPILRNVAEWIESRGQFTERGFEVEHMMGPDEGLSNLSNQGYFNLLARMAISAAIDCCRRLGMSPPASWQQIHDTIVIPRSRASGVILPFEGASESRGGYSLGNLQYLFLHGSPVDEEALRATCLHEERIRAERLATGRVPGGAELPGFTTGPFAVAAAFLGDRWKAAGLFTTAWKPFWIEPFGMTRECAAHSYGGFVTNNGSLLQTVLLGFTGLRIGEGLDARYPASMPEGWERIEVERIWDRGTAKRLVAEHGRRALLTEP